MRSPTHAVTRAGVRTAAKVALIVPLLVSPIGCGSDGSGPTAPQADVVTIELFALPSLYLGQKVGGSATVLDASGKTMTTGSVSWSTSSPGIIKVEPQAPYGQRVTLTALAAGTVELYGVSGGKTGTLQITVRPPGPVASISLLRSFRTPLDVGIQLAPILRDSNGVVLTGRAVTYASRTPAVASVSLNGFVTPASVGVATLTITSEDTATELEVSVQLPQRAVLWSPTTGMRDLGTLDGHTRSSASGINESGEVAGTSTTVRLQDGSPAGYTAFRWTLAAGMVALPSLPGSPGSQAFAINNASIIVGAATVPGGQWHAVSWTAGGTIQDLGTLPGELSSMALAVSDAGTVVGVSGSKAFIWTQSAGMKELISSPPSGARASGVNVSGVVVGDVDGQPFRWTTTTGVTLFAGLGKYDTGRAVAINVQGDILGVYGYDCGFYCYYGPEPQHLMIWTALGQSIEAGTGYDSVEPAGLNTAGQVAATIDGRAVLWSKASGFQNLGPLKAHTVSFARGINDGGTVVGGSQ